MIVLDTNVVSAMMRFEHEPTIVAWLDRQHVSQLFITTITLFELQFGVSRMPEGRRKTMTAARLQTVMSAFFDQRVLPFEQAAAAEAAAVHVLRGKSKSNAEAPDTMIAGIAKSLGAAIATRDEADFRGLNLKLINPWKA
jgi:toxin FitB